MKLKRKMMLLIVFLMIAFTSLSQKDTTSKICFPRQVVINIQKDLNRLDYCDSIIYYQDSALINRENKINELNNIIRFDSVKINLLKDNEKLYQGIVNVKDKQIQSITKDNSKLKRNNRILIGFSFVMFGLGVFIAK